MYSDRAFRTSPAKSGHHEHGQDLYPFVDEAIGRKRKFARPA